MKSFSARISGIVQGVGFRYSTLMEARRLGLCGYVKNLPDGSVEVAAEGESAVVERFRAWLEKGPRGAVVRDFRLTELPCQKRFRDFSIEY